MKFSYAVENLRRIKSMPEIEIRPITVLLGRNSVGKSTFLRSFPLLRQSEETKTSAPILWFGDYVDFGDYRRAVTDQDEAKEIRFSFGLEEYTGTVTSDDYKSSFFRRRPEEISVDQAQIKYSIRSKEELTIRDVIELGVPSLKATLTVKFDQNSNKVHSVRVNNFNLSELLENYTFFNSSENLFSDLVFVKKIKGDAWHLASITTALQELIGGELRKYAGQRISDRKIAQEARRILRNKFLDKEILDRLSSTDTQTFKKIYSTLARQPGTPLRALLNNICLANYLLHLLRAIGESLVRYFGAVEYIGPARARSERYYRRQELEVSDIAPDGQNLPMFLASLPHNSLSDFSDWVKNAFGYGVSVYKTEGHISVNLTQESREINVVDTGYGVSQVLPVLAQIWWMQRRGSRRGQYSKMLGIGRQTLAIEQPELHLHPAHQALLADVFADAIVSTSISGPEMCFLIETHSEALINRLGELIEAGKLAPESVQIVVFGEDTQQLDQIVLAEFDKSGTLCNWPFGFFNYP